VVLSPSANISLFGKNRLSYLLITANVRARTNKIHLTLEALPGHGQRPDLDRASSLNDAFEGMVAGGSSINHKDPRRAQSHTRHGQGAADPSTATGGGHWGQRAANRSTSVRLEVTQAWLGGLKGPSPSLAARVEASGQTGSSRTNAFESAGWGGGGIPSEKK